MKKDLVLYDTELNPFSLSNFCDQHKLDFFYYSTVTDLARLRGLSTSSPRCRVAK